MIVADALKPTATRSTANAPWPNVAKTKVYSIAANAPIYPNLAMLPIVKKKAMMIARRVIKPLAGNCMLIPMRMRNMATTHPAHVSNV